MTLRGWLPERWVAVDFDQRTIRGVVARRWGGAWTVEGWGQEDWAEPAEGEEATPPADSPTDPRTAALRRLLDALPVQYARLVLVLPRGFFLERVLTVPPLVPRHLRALVTQELDADLPWTAGERYDGLALLPGAPPAAPLPERPSDGAPLPLPSLPRAKRSLHPALEASPRRLLAITGQRDSLAPWLEACRAAGARVAGVVPAGVALLNAFRTSGEPGTGFLVGARNEVDLVSLAGGDWGFSRAFPRAEAEAEIARSRQFVAPEGDGTVDLWVPAGASGSPPAGFALREWCPAGVGELPAEYWAAWGALLAAGGSAAALPLVLDNEAKPTDWLLRPETRVGALALAAAVAFLGAGAGVYRVQQQRATDRASAVLAGQAAELAAWRGVAFPLDQRLATLESVAASLPAGTRLEALRLERDRLVEFRAVAPQASAVLSALTGTRGLTELALAGPVVRRAEGGEVFSLVGRLTPPAPAPKPAASTAGRTRAVAALRTLGWSNLPPDKALTRLLLEVEKAAAQTGLRLETKTAQLLASLPGHQRLGVDVSFTGGDRSLAAFLGALAERNPLLSLDVLAGRRIFSGDAGGATSFRLQLVLDRPSAVSPGARPVPDLPSTPQGLAEAAGLTVPRGGAYAQLWAGRLFGLGASPAGPPRPAGTPAPLRSSLVLLGLVYDPAGNPRALVRPAGGGATVVVKPGDTLGEEKVVEIRQDGLVVEVQGTRVRLPLP